MSAYPSGLRGLSAKEIFIGSNPIADSNPTAPFGANFTGSKAIVGYVIEIWDRLMAGRMILDHQMRGSSPAPKATRGVFPHSYTVWKG